MVDEFLDVVVLRLRAEDGAADPLTTTLSSLLR